MNPYQGLKNDTFADLDFTATNSIPVWDETTPLLATATETESHLSPGRRPAEFSRSLPRQQTGWGLSNRWLPPVLGELLGGVVVGSALHLLFQKVGRTVLVWS